MRGWVHKLLRLLDNKFLIELRIYFNNRDYSKYCAIYLNQLLYWRLYELQVNSILICINVSPINQFKILFYYYWAVSKILVKIYWQYWKAYRHNLNTSIGNTKQISSQYWNTSRFQAILKNVKAIFKTVRKYWKTFRQYWYTSRQC